MAQGWLPLSGRTACPPSPCDMQAQKVVFLPISESIAHQRLQPGCLVKTGSLHSSSALQLAISDSIFSHQICKDRGGWVVLAEIVVVGEDDEARSV